MIEIDNILILAGLIQTANLGISGFLFSMMVKHITDREVHK